MKNRKHELFVHSCLILFAVIMIGPFIWMFLTSIKTYEETIRIPMQFFPKDIRWINYKIVYEKFPFLLLYCNTIIVSIFTVIGQLIVVSLSAYAFARIKFRFKNVLFIGMLALMMLPGQIFIIPRYQLMVGLKMTNTLTALVLPSLFSVFGVFLLRQFFQAIPMELEESAKLDGCGHFRTYWTIMMPLVTPGLVALGILTMLNTWKDLMWPIIVNRTMNKMTLSAGLAMLIGQHTTYYEQVMAGAVISVLPMIIIYLIFQKQFVESIAKTGIKG